MSLNDLPEMPRTLSELEQSIEASTTSFVRDIARLCETSGAGFRDLLAESRRLMGRTSWRWPILEGRGLNNEAKLSALVHTIMMLAAKEREASSYKESEVVGSVEILSARDEHVCPRCLERDGQSVARPWEHLELLPPFHPGCRCTTLPVLDES